MTQSIRAAAALALTLAWTLSGSTPAQAEDGTTRQLVKGPTSSSWVTAAESDSMDFAIDDVVSRALETTPGGYATGDHSAYWPNLAMELSSIPTGTLSAVTASRAVGSCATGSVCAYSGSNLSGSKLSWTSCGSHSTSALASVRSIANGRTSGTLQARNGSTVVASAAPGSQKNVSGTVTNVSC